MDICVKARNDEEATRALQLNYNCVVYSRPLNNILTFIPDQYISDININNERTVVITDSLELINTLKSRNLKIAYRVNKPYMNILIYGRSRQNNDFSKFILLFKQGKEDRIARFGPGRRSDHILWNEKRT